MVYLAGLEGLSGRKAAQPCPISPPPLLAVTPNSAKPDLPHRPGRSNRRADFAARLKARARFLRTELERRDTLLEAIRSANATLDYKRVAGWLVHQARSWISAPCWVVIAYDVSGDLDV